MNTGKKDTDNVSIEKKNKKYIEAYSKCNQVKLKFGNYVAIERIITDKKAIIFIAILVIMTVYFSFVEERNSGVYELFFSMKNGTTKIYITKYFACVTICIIEVALLLTVQLLAYISIYGISDLNVSIQSVGILVNSPYPISVFMMIVLYFTFLFFITIMLVAIFSCIGSCPTGLMGYMMGIVIYLLINFTFFKFINNTSSINYLKDTSLFRIMDFSYWIKRLRIYSVGKFIFGGTFYPLISICIVTAVSIIISLRIWKNGVRVNSRSGINLLKNLHFNSSCFFNEAKIYWIFNKRLVLMSIILCFFGFGVLSYKKNISEIVQFEREYVELLNNKEINEAEIFLHEKQDELDRIRKNIEKVENDFLNKKIEISEYEILKSQLQNQLRFENQVNDLLEQSKEIRKIYEDTGKVISYEFKAYSGALFSEEGKNTRYMVAIIIGVFVVFSTAVIFPYINEKNTIKLLGTMQDSCKCMNCRIFHMMISVMIFSCISYCLWFFSIHKQYGTTGFDINLQSWKFFRSSILSTNLRIAVLLEIIVQSIKWTMVSGIIILLSFLIKKVFYAQIIGSVLIILPFVLKLIGVEISDNGILNMMTFGKNTAIINEIKIIMYVVCIIAEILVLRMGVKRWSKLTIKNLN